MYSLLFFLFRYIILFVYRSCDHLLIANIVFISPLYIYMIMLLSFSPIFPCVVSFLSLYTCFFMYAIFYFCFILRCLDKFCLKCFKKTVCQNLSCHELSSCKIFQEFVLELDFVIFNKWLWVEWFMTSLILHFFVVVLSRIAKGGYC